MSTHTILLLQQTNDKRSRTWLDRETVEQAILALVNIFEAKLRELNPGLPNITYELADIDRWIDNMPDISALVYSAASKSYVPHGRAWVKQRVNQHMYNQANVRR